MPQAIQRETPIERIYQVTGRKMPLVVKRILLKKRKFRKPKCEKLIDCAQSRFVWPCSITSMVEKCV
jgi:hypothetical protein